MNGAHYIGFVWWERVCLLTHPPMLHAFSWLDLSCSPPTHPATPNSHPLPSHIHCLHLTSSTQTCHLFSREILLIQRLLCILVEHFAVGQLGTWHNTNSSPSVVCVCLCVRACMHAYMRLCVSDLDCGCIPLHPKLFMSCVDLLLSVLGCLYGILIEWLYRCVHT